MMKKINRFFTLKQEDCEYTFLPTGDIFTFLKSGFLINQFRGNGKDGSVNNIWLRVYENDTTCIFPLLGIRSDSTISVNESSIQYKGQVKDISYQVTFYPVGSIWFWNVSLEGTQKEVDLVYGQDIGVGSEGGIYTNELYNSQYLGHSVYQKEGSFVICSRQNMPMNDQNPYLQQGILGAKAIHFSTDGLSFFGLSCKETGIPEALSSNLEDINLQYEFAYTALQTERFFLDGKRSLAFYGLFLSDHKEAVTGLEYQDEILSAYASYQEISVGNQVPVVKIKEEFSLPYSSLSFSKEEIAELFPERSLEEEKDQTLLSFFTPDHAHVVTKEKELLTERPHGTIIITPPDENEVNSALLSSTSYMYGIFNSHVVIGNTDMHKFISTPRGFLNLLKNSGQRLYVRIGKTYHLLNLPGLFEMGMNYTRWFYKFSDDVLVITSYMAVSSPDLVLEVTSKKNKAYDFILTNQICMGPNEHMQDINYEKNKDGLRFVLQGDTYPGLHYDLVFPNQSYSISDDRIFFEKEEPFDETFLTVSFLNTSSLVAILRGSLDDKESCVKTDYEFQTEKQAALHYYQAFLRHFNLEGKNKTEQLSILNETAYWYAHNALIHFATPHGLEQPGGAAWGTRDICQGPIEFFLTTQHHSLVRNILLNIFSHQSKQTREWPQWFMFDRYPINAGECHGDVIFWPLKCVADYLLATGDKDILKELLPYEESTEKKETLFDHIKLAIANIEETRFLKNTGLITYAGGDWDDTLQPANEELKQRLVSAWTVALAYQTFVSLSEALLPEEEAFVHKLQTLADKLKKAFETYLIQEDVIAGFLDFDKECVPMLHPSDKKTGIHYRLLPLTRSIISQLATPDQAEKNVEIIDNHLKCPDGVRLMDKPASYDGGISHLFKRAEQAANVGREISLQYTHAHIRYIEAIAKLGKSEEAFDSLFTINPILITHTVKNARIRQSNLYFSSSDGAYPDRYEYCNHFDLLKTGEIEVKGGWRLYSSGPGIYLRQLIANILGVRFCERGMILDPNIPSRFDGLCFTYECFEQLYHFSYHFTDTSILYATYQGRLLPYEVLDNPYREGGILICKEDLPKSEQTIDIYIPN